MQSLWVGPWLLRVAGWQPLQAAGSLFAINARMLATFWTWACTIRCSRGAAWAPTG
ncbi:MAG: hypothetical protein NVS2B4_18090 [Ramlibacter sp.]